MLTAAAGRESEGGKGSVLRRGSTEGGRDVACRALFLSVWIADKDTDAYIGQLDTVLSSVLTLPFPPYHYCIDEGLGLSFRDVTKGCYQLIKVGINPRPAYTLHSRFWLAAVCEALANFYVGLWNELNNNC